MIKKSKAKKLFERITPVMIDLSQTSIRFSLSRRFVLFEAINSLRDKIDENPYLNFISLMKYERKISPFLSGNIRKMYKERTRTSFKNFFHDKEVYKLVREDIEYVYDVNKDLNMTISKDGIVMYDNYKQNQFNILLMTIHSGTFVPESIENKMALTPKQRWLEEDVDSNRLYCKLVLKQGGIWIDNKHSRFYCDLNRSFKGCIYENGKLDQLKEIWKEELSKKETNNINSFYSNFYETLAKLLESYNFNVIFDAHTMKDLEGRPDISFGTDYIPKFYLPIVRSIRRKITNLGYEKVGINNPYGGGYILKYLSEKFPSLFIFSMEVNKKLYMTVDRNKSIIRKREKVADDLVYLFDIMEEEGFRMN